MTVLLKVCGATSRDDIALLAAAGTDLIGLWHGVTGGRADLPAARLTALAHTCRTLNREQREGTAPTPPPEGREAAAVRAAPAPREERGGAARTPPAVWGGPARGARTGVVSPEPVMVTFLRDPAAILGAARAAGVRWLQLHGYQPPAVVAALKRGQPGVVVVKVVHVTGDACVERPLLASYERAGTDLFLFDAATAQGRIGSTGLALDAGVVSGLAGAITRPFLLAGGISAAARPRYRKVAAHPRFAGVDVDTGARDAAGAFCPASVRGIRENWRTAPGTGEGV
ncbi:N-(5'-phosphoribosyl)anthranilate isomerase [Streptomyces sp. NPDC059477]|uniref:phosphoribosylanthranilate isomerase n=1 Tax=Streptomyces sp. NPDC059477 TaxID=3346847 RepID=UPI0036A2057D